MAPKEVVINQATGRISHLVLARTEQDEDTGEWKIDEEETLKKVFYSVKMVSIQIFLHRYTTNFLLLILTFQTHPFLSVVISSFLHLAQR